MQNRIPLFAESVPCVVSTGLISCETTVVVYVLDNQAKQARSEQSAAHVRVHVRTRAVFRTAELRPVRRNNEASQNCLRETDQRLHWSRQGPSKQRILSLVVLPVFVMVQRHRAGSSPNPPPELRRAAPQSERPEQSTSKTGPSTTVLIGLVVVVGLVVLVIFAYRYAFQKADPTAPLLQPLQKGIGNAAKGIGLETPKITVRRADSSTAQMENLKTSTQFKSITQVTTQGSKSFRILNDGTTTVVPTKGAWKPIQSVNATGDTDDDQKIMHNEFAGFLARLPHGCTKPDVPCGDRRTCINPIRVCDGHPDCPNQSDEQSCVKLHCRKGLFKCSINQVERCIRSTAICDGVGDCDDHSDELHCNGSANNTPDFFEDMPLNLGGNDGHRRPQTSKQPHPGAEHVGPPQRRPHTPKPSPAARIFTRTPVFGRASSPGLPPEGAVRSRRFEALDEECTKSEFACKTTRTCVPSQWRCDGTADCEDGSDEVNCTKRVCLEPFVSCSDQSSCVLKKKLCDGKFDCSDKSDEGSCARCVTPLVKCATVNRCIDKSSVCNGIAECEDRSDEDNCKSRKSLLNGDKEGEKEECRSREFACKSTHECIPMRWLCDGSEDCEDGSDEEMCPRSNQRLANLRHKDEEGKSVPLGKNQPALLHNAPMHMPPGAGKNSGNKAKPSTDEDEYEDEDREFHEDESDDGAQQGPKKGRRPSGKIDDDDDPEYHLDEKTKPEGEPKFKAVTYRPVPCKKDQFRCVDNSECIPLSWKCDGNEDCSDGSDEKKCRKVCEPAEFYTTCGDGVTCIPKNAICDGVVDCKDGHDEANCSKAVTSPSLNALKGSTAPEEERLKFPDCPADYFKCKTGGNCIMNILVCDDEEDCKDGSDEQNCAKQCPSSHFQCETDKTCIKRIFRCDGDVDCEDASDERNCD
ncbi:low-density lipoprotein receptor-related protein 1B-like isoform X2 [Ornithodoros turicata]|uniref:low-density lipoprotein receptor-related protein 1B-like isoform X2 n=1 Tax=Ornithodoros turicata TaxID=34597 RepID=UPI0031394F1C